MGDIIRLATSATVRDLRPELAATHRRYDRLQRAKDAALLSLHDDLDEECSRVGLTAGAGMDEVRRIEEEIAAMRRVSIATIVK